MPIMSEEQKIIDLENEISFLKDALCEKIKLIDKKNSLIDVLQHRIEELLDNKKEINYIKPIDIPVHNYISEDKIREKIKAFQDAKKEIIKNENKLLRASITYDIVRNDYCEKMLQDLLKERIDE